MTSKFERERDRVALLMRELAIVVDEYQDPNARGLETGADVVAMVGGRPIAIQVTDIDTGDRPGTARADEKKRARAAAVYGVFGQNDPAKMVEAIARGVERKAVIADGHQLAGDPWLLMSANVAELGAVASTFLMTPWLHVDALNAATSVTLSRSRYSRAYVHPHLGVERALYQWDRQRGWQNLIRSDSGMQRQASRVWDLLDMIQRR